MNRLGVEGLVEQALERAARWWQEGREAEALELLAHVGKQATDEGKWLVALHAHRLTAEIWFHLGDWGRALSHAAESLYLSLEHVTEETLPSLGQVLAFVEQAVAAGHFALAVEVGAEMARVVEAIAPGERAKGLWQLAYDVARLMALVGEAGGRKDHPAFAEAAALAALIDQATEGRLRLNTWVHSTVERTAPASTRPPSRKPGQEE